MQTSLVFAIALSVAVIIIILGLCVALVYCRWRRSEMMSGLGEFLNENRRLRQELKRSQMEKKMEEFYYSNEEEGSEDQSEISEKAKPN